MEPTKKSRPWIRDTLILALLAYIIFDAMAHEWSKGYQEGYREGYRHGVAQEPQAWKVLAPALKID